MAKLNNKKKITSIIFDMGGVILDINSKPTFNVPVALSKMFKIPIDQAQQIWETCDRQKIVTGHETPKHFLNRIAKKLRLKMDTDKLLSQWTKYSQKDKNCINWQLMDFIAQLRKKYKVYILSDTINVAQNDKFTQQLRSRFDGYFVSYEQGFKKTDSQAFLNVLSKTSSKPEQTIFIDDTEKYVLAAQNLNLNAILYTSLPKLKKEINLFLCKTL